MTLNHSPKRCQSGVRTWLVSALVLALVAFLTGCAQTAVSGSHVDRALGLMTGVAQAPCDKTLDFQDGSAEFRCGIYYCWSTAGASYHGYGHVIDGADYFDCDDRYSKASLSGKAYTEWKKCVVDDHTRMRILSEKECRMGAWMGGSSIGGF